MTFADGQLRYLRSPNSKPADHRGAGDSMTAALAVGLARKMGTEEILQLNVTRRALGTGTGTQVEQLAKLADLHEAP